MAVVLTLHEYANPSQHSASGGVTHGEIVLVEGGAHYLTVCTVGKMNSWMMQACRGRRVVARMCLAVQP